MGSHIQLVHTNITNQNNHINRYGRGYNHYGSVGGQGIDFGRGVVYYGSVIGVHVASRIDRNLGVDASNASAGR